MNRRNAIKKSVLAAAGVMFNCYSLGQTAERLDDPYANASEIPRDTNLLKQHYGMLKGEGRGELMLPEFRKKFHMYERIFKFDKNHGDDIVVVSYFMHTPPGSDASGGYFELYKQALKDTDADLFYYLSFMKSGGTFEQYNDAKLEAGGDTDVLSLFLWNIIKTDGMTPKKLSRRFKYRRLQPSIKAVHVNVSRAAVCFTGFKNEGKTIEKAREPLPDYPWL